ncbi:MAG: ABC transporter substrate-binding protein, partial [Chloroflexi bacterium]|nr:ABC transporter substrate-binding protein [Chloroflexota bacterium]
MNDERLSRRRLLKLAAGSMFALAVAPVLIGCTDDDDDDPPAASGNGESSTGGGTTAAATATRTATATATDAAAATATPTATAAAAAPAPASGGRVRVANGGSATATFNPFNASGSADYAGFYHVFDSLARLGGSEVLLGVAESIESNVDGTVWTIVLHDATFHDGRPLTSADVAYTLRTYTDPEVAPVISGGFSMVDAANISTPDARTVVVPLTIPRGDFLDAELAISSFVLPEGSIGGPGAIGTGAFKLEAYEASSSIRMVRNADYWNTPPLLDELEIVVVNDPTARLNALKGGEVEFARGITPAAARAEDGNDDIVLHRGGAANSQAMGFAANITIPPFDNPDAVRALKLAVDRQSLVDTVLLGFGEVGNDLVGKALPGYADAIPQTERDVRQARALFERAGVTELTMLTGETTAGTVAAAELLVQQLAEAGVSLTLDELPADQYYADFARLFSTPLQSCWWVNRPADVHLSSFTGSSAGFNLTGLRGTEYDALLASARVSVNRDERLAIVQQLQQYAFDHDGMVIWGYREDLNAS